MRIVRPSRLLWVLATALLYCACPSCNSSRDLPTAGIYFDVPPSMRAGQVASWRANMQNLVPPFSVEWDFGGGADPNTLTSGTEFDSAPADVLMLNDSPSARTYRLEARIRDGLGDIWLAQTDYVVHPPNNAPVLLGAEFDRQTRDLTISARDADGDTLLVSLELPNDLLADHSALSIEGGEGSAVFRLIGFNSTAQFFNDEISFRIEDGAGGSISGSVLIQIGLGTTNPNS